MLTGNKSKEINKSLSNENIFNYPSFKNRRTPVILTKTKPKISLSIERDQLFTKKPSLKLQKIKKFDQKNLITSSVELSSKSKEDEIFLSNLIKIEEILKMSEKDFEMNGDDPRNPNVYLNIIKRKFVL